MKKDWISKIGVLMMSLTLAVTGVSYANETHPLKDGKAMIYEINGEVRVWRESQGEWVRGQEGLELSRGDRIITSKNAMCIVWFDPDGKDMARMQEESEMVFRNVEPTEAYLKQGHVLVKLDELAAGTTFKIGTNDAVTGVFGTTFEVIKKGPRTCVIGREGKVRVFETKDGDAKAEFAPSSWWQGQGIMGR